MATVQAATPSSNTQEGTAGQRFADFNRLVVRNTFLDVQAHGEEEGYESDNFETGDFNRAATEPVLNTAPIAQDMWAAAAAAVANAGMNAGMNAGTLGPISEGGSGSWGNRPAPVAAQPYLQEEPAFIVAGNRFPWRQKVRPSSFVPHFADAVPVPGTGQTTNSLFPRYPSVTWAPNENAEGAQFAGWQRGRPAVPPPACPPTLPQEPPQPQVSWSSEDLDVGLVAQAAMTISPTLAEQSTLIAIREMVPSVCLADPSIPDFPIIGCSDGFETLTGYARSEIIGQNCRILNRGMRLNPTLRARLRDAVAMGTEFIGVIPNMRKNGKRFQNLLHLTTLTVREKRYVIGVQADASHISIDPRNAGHRAALKEAAERIFSGNVDAWIQLQAREFSIRLPAPLSQLLKLGSPAHFAREQRRVVRFGSSQGGPDGTGTGSSFGTSSETGDRPCGGMRGSCSTTAETTPEVTVAGAVQQEATGESARPPNAEEPLKSIGSALHPDRCVECCFHFFGPQGCRAGEKCEFCHEFHPRKNAKKNRRLIKRLANADCSGNELGAEPDNVTFADSTTQMVTEQQPLSQPTLSQPQPSQPPPPLQFPPPQQPPAPTYVPQLPADVDQGKRGSSPECTTVTADAGRMPTTEKVSEQELPEMLRVVYGDEGRETMILGIRVHIKPRIIFTTSETQTGLEGCLKFSVQPALPHGLVLDPNTGTIHGTPDQGQHSSRHVVTIKTVAVGPGGIALGEVPLTSALLELRILPRSSLTLFSPAENVGEGDSCVRLTFNIHLARVQ